MKVVIWARVSSREQREGYSIDAQLRATRERANALGWQIAREFVVAESAKRGAERAVVLSIAEYRQLVKARPNLRDYLLGGPKVDEFEVERPKDYGRGTEL